MSYGRRGFTPQRSSFSYQITFRQIPGHDDNWKRERQQKQTKGAKSECTMVLGEVNAPRVEGGPSAERNWYQRHPSQGLEYSAPQVESCKNEARNDKDANLDHWRMATPLPNETRLSCGALKKDSFHNLRAPSASSAC
jgi:hypothetical protein